MKTHSFGPRKWETLGKSAIQRTPLTMGDKKETLVILTETKISTAAYVIFISDKCCARHKNRSVQFAYSVYRMTH